MHKNNLFKRLMSLLVCFAIIAACLPVFALDAAAANTTLYIVEDSKKADPSTLDGWKQYFGPDKMDTEFAGAVWTDKSVFDSATNELPGVTLDGSNNFLVSLSAIASNMSITGHTSSPTDTMLVLDMSGSMVDDTYEVGTVRQGNNNYQTANGIDMSLIEAMVDATNATIDTLMKQNTNNRVGVVLYSGNTSSNQDATPGTATVVLPLGRYAGVDGEYLSIDTTWRTADLYRYVSTSWFGGRWEATGETATYVPSGTAINVSVKDGLETESGGDVTDRSKQATGGTYIQNGLYQAMNQFLNNSIDTVVPEGRPQAGAERMPVIVLMTDGAPTIATTSYNNVGDSNEGDGTSTTDRITFLTQLTAAYVRGRVAAKYQENENDEKDILFLTLGLGTENSSAATNTLYPAGSNSTLVGYWNNYLNGRVNTNVQITSGNNGWRVYRDAAVEAMNYVDKYFYASNAEGLINSFNDILGEIELKAESYATLVEGSSADFSGYVTFEDELGEMMQVADVKGILMNNGQGGTVLYTGKGIAEGMNNGNLGTVDGPTERGDELIRTVKERIPGTTTTQAQQLVNSAYLDGQLYYENDDNWSNYIGWYADANGNYVGFWDKDSGYENAPTGAVYANRSYGYLGVNGDSDMMHVVVMVRTELATLHQTVLFKIPASLLPTVHYNVTLQEDNPSGVEKFVREDAIPMRLVFEVGLRDDINSVNLNRKIAEHLQKGGHIHRNDDGTVTFYTNEWAIGNDTNGNGIPDLSEVETALVAESHFHPALDNSRFYYTEDTIIHDESGNPASGASRPSGNGYHYDRYIYSENGRQVIKTPIDETTLANDAVYDDTNGYWYIPAGTMYRNFARFKTLKTANDSGTLDYSFYPTVFENGTKQDVYTFLGNNGSITVAPAQGIALTKTVDAVSEEQGAPTEFTFVVTLSQAVAEPVITDTDGNVLAGISSVDGNKITVTLTAGQTVVISGIPTGTTYEVAEEVTDFYTASSANATGTVAAYTVHPVDFVNTAKAYGALVVSKDVNYPEGFAPGSAHNGKEFPITVEFTGDITGMTVPQEATQNGNTFSLLLKDGQSVTFLSIPEGVTYTVTEGQNPDGYTFQELRYSDINQTIDGNDLDEAHVVNSYALQPVSPNVKVQGDKTLVTNEGSWNGESFTVELLRSDHFADEEPVSTGLTDTMTQTDPTYEIDLSSITFDAVGTYYFRVVEQIPDNRNENIAYDRTFGLFSVTVGDANADGNLEIQAVHAYQSTTISGDSASGWVLTKDFTNVVTTDRIYLDIQKQVVDAASGLEVDVHKGDITFGLFTAMDSSVQTPAYYTLTDTHGDATLMIPVTKEIIDASGGALVYYLREIAPAVENRVVGMNYDESWIYAIEITWNTTSNSAEMKYAPIVDGQVDTFEVYTEGDVTFQHTNTYESNVSASIALSGNKTLNGGTDLGGREFSFSLYKSSAAFVKGDLIRTVTNSGSNIPFGSVSFSAPGIYYMVAVENDTDLGGITEDTTEYHITVEVESFTDSDGTTRLRVVSGYPQVVAYGTSTDVGANGLNFHNLYTVTGSGDVAIGGKKVLTGRALAASEFAIGLYSDEACTDLIATAYNLADGTFSFPAITYTVEDLGEGYAEQVYTYYVKEIAGDLGGVAYDPNVYTVTVTVSHENGKLTVTPSDNALTLQISNTYAAAPVTVALSGSKLLSGDWSAVTDKAFTFELYRTGADFVVAADQAPVLTRSVNGAEAFSIGLTYADGQEDTYYYVLKEAIPDQRAGGVGYDAGEYHITVSVSDPGDGHLVAQKTVYRPGTGNVSTTDFTNAYTVAPTSITLVGEKSFINSANNQPIAMKDNDFTFVVLENGAPVVIGYNKADGSIYFPEIHYAKPGVHNYEIREVSGEIGYIAYDDAVFYVTVTVTDNGDGTLTAAADYAGVDVLFENTYIPGAAQVNIEGIKTFSGDWSKVPDANKEFTFALYPADQDFTITGDALDEAGNINGAFEFMTLSYAEEGTHYYVVKEIAGDQNIGISYSDAQMQITVVVEDNGSGKLIPTVTTNFSGAAVTPDQNDANIVTVSGLEFVNTYSVEPISKVLTATKEYDGKNMLDFKFDLIGEDSTGEIHDRKSVDAATGIVTFDALNFYTPGTYEFTVKEYQSILGGFIKWDTTEYTVVIEVIDNGKGGLEVESVSYTDENGAPATGLNFHNGYQMEDNELVLSVKKTMTGDATTGRDFTFGLYADLNAEPIDTVTILAVDKTAAKEASFQKLIYKQADVATGTFTYYIKEILPAEGNKKDGITYDDTVYTVVVTLTDDEAGNIGISYTVDGNDVNEDTYKFAFENKYEHEPVTYTITAQKQYEGDDMKAFTFQLSGEGFETQTKQNTVPDGIVTFDTLTFTAPGTYTFQLSERAEALWDFIKWDVNRYTIQIKVVDNEKGHLVIPADGVTVTSTLGRDDLVFRNVHEDLIIKKDVFLNGDKNISIDGKQVQIGDVLTYSLTYTNYTGTIVDAAVITDVIPAHTAYVEGSASNGGTFDGTKLTWNFKNVPADEIITVSFQVKVTGAGVTVKNQGQVLEGDNTYRTNEVTASVSEPTPPPSTPSDNPNTGDKTPVTLLATAMLFSLACLFVLVLSRKHTTE